MVRRGSRQCRAPPGAGPSHLGSHQAAPAGETQQDRHEHQPHQQRVEQHRDAETFGGSGPDRANVRNTATITAPAAKITRPEWASPPTIASRGSWLRSQCSFPYGTYAAA
jgi:hypothetical protein